MAREYRVGEIPDIQIKLCDLIKPLQQLALVSLTFIAAS